MIQLSAGDESFSAYRADPAGSPKGAVIVLHDVFGVDDHIRKIADDLAAAGYVAIAPALFDKVKADTTLSPAQENDGRALAAQVGTDWSLSAIQAAVDAATAAGKVAVVGYSWGGYLAYHCANRVKGVACAIGYYADGVLDGSREKRRVPTLLHFAEKDALLPEGDIDQFRAARPDVSTYLYPGTAHGFFFGPAYDADAAQLAQERTLFWISQHVVGQPPVQLKNAGAYAQSKTERKAKKGTGEDLGPPES
ncbi:dienelactone hydrolase family protein [Xanthobacter variabilis]|uniref:dienelactone hydrolase family protein n=1 Tax=Xanthobacter variabilis TaxID=3119932 RepID=UPI00372C345D